MNKINSHAITDIEVRSNPLGRVVAKDVEGNPLSYMFSDSWDFRDEREIGVGKQSVISFENINPIELRRSVQIALSSIYENEPDLSVSSIETYRKDLIGLAKFLESYEWGDLDDDVKYKIFLQNLKAKKYSDGYTRKLGCLINKINKTGLSNRYIPYIKGFAKKYACTVKKAQQAIAIPEGMASRIFKEALDIVENYHPHRHHINQMFSDYAEEREKWKQHGKAQQTFRKTFKKKIGKSEQELGVDGYVLKYEMLTLIQSAALAVVLGFSGARINEAITFNRNSYHIRKYGDIEVPIIQGFITKTEEGGIPRKEAWVVSPSVKDALELAYDITDFVREIYRKHPSMREDSRVIKSLETPFISVGFEKVFSGGRKDKDLAIGSSQVAMLLGRFIKKVGIVATKDDVAEFDLLNPNRAGDMKVGEPLPKLTAHDFRRTFAVFLVRNRLGNISTVKYQLKHLNAAMSQWYANNSDMARIMDLALDEELQGMIQEANIEMATNAIFDIYNSETLSGAKGDEIIKERKEVCYSGSIYMSREEIERQLRGGTISFVEHPTGYCFKPNCKRICSSDRSSVSCQHEVITIEKIQSRIPVRERYIKRYQALKEVNNMPNILTDIALKIEAIEENLSAHNIPFSPFEMEA